MMKIYLYLDAHRLDFFHRFSSTDMVSPLTLRFRRDRRQVSRVRFQKRQRHSSILKLNDKRTVPQIKLKMCLKNRGTAVIRQ